MLALVIPHGVFWSGLLSASGAYVTDLVPPAGRTSYTNALFDRWRAAAGGSGRLRVEVVDPSGAVVSEKSGPGTL